MTPKSSGFRETDLVRRRRHSEGIARLIFLAATVAMVIPLIAIVAFLAVKAAPVLSLDFILKPPSHGMRAGGVWPAFLGTIYLVLTSLAIATPIGVFAAVYLNEYAPDNWITRAINLAVVNLAGIPSIVHALFGLGAFVAFAHIGRSILAASLTLAIMTLPVIIASTKKRLRRSPCRFVRRAGTPARPAGRRSGTSYCPTPSAAFSRASFSRYRALPAKPRR